MDEQDSSPAILLHEEQEEQEEEEEEEEDTPNSDWLKLTLATSSDRQPNLLSEAPPVTRPPQPRMLWNRGDSSDVTGGPQLRSETPEFFMRAPAFVAPGPGVRMRVVSPPRRSQPGVWLILQAAQNQSGREPYLPQIARNYLRIKDGRSTLSLLMKYLVKKLGLEDESEVEITCRDQQLHPLLRLQYVRDTIWCSGNSMIMTPNSSAIDHVMTLQYRRNPSPSANLIQQQPKINYSTRSLQNSFQWCIIFYFFFFAANLLIANSSFFCFNPMLEQILYFLLEFLINSPVNL